MFRLNAVKVSAAPFLRFFRQGSRSVFGEISGVNSPGENYLGVFTKVHHPRRFSEQLFSPAVFRPDFQKFSLKLFAALFS
jgi:hypothetical protein